MAEHPNVVLVVMDTTRADDGFDATVAPTLAELGEAGTNARQAISPAPWTLPSHASMLTGTYPSKHGAHAGHERLGDSPTLLSECFSDAGYETACVSNNTWLSTESGFGRGFDSFQQMWQLVQSGTALGELVEVTEQRRLAAVARRLFDGNPIANAANLLYRLLVRERKDEGAARTKSWITEWLAERDDEQPFFLLANFLEPHLEYRPPRRLAERYLPESHTYEEAMAVPQQPWRHLAGHQSLSDEDLRALRGLYRAEIAYLDEHLAALKQALVDATEWEETVIVVTADHGENVGDHGLMDHQYCLYDTLLHVPLVIHGGSFVGGETVDDPVSLTDLAPTLLDETGIDAPDFREHAQGRSVHPDTEAEPRDRIVAEYMTPQPSMDTLETRVGDLPEAVREYGRSLRAVRTDRYKYIRGSDGSRELYDVRHDPSETEDLGYLQ